jgi:hypothetical protein
MFVNVTVGAQAPSQSLTINSAPEIYLEPASIRSSQDVGGGAFFDVAAGYKIWRNLTVGAGYTRVSSEADLTVNADIPDPLLPDQPRPVTFDVSGAKHIQQAIHLMGTWMMPVTDKIDVGFQFGPTIYLVSQDLPGDFTVTEPGPSVTSRLIQEDKTTVGLHLGVDTTYLLTPRYGIGVLARYVWASADLASATDNLTTGGFQIGAGLRVRFQ